ncbi:MAG: folate-binding protein YgfZ [Betaproteobacteria bacterium]|nr:folate-binding protein YgfZ [Betaproteobacteria bacterium]
MPNRSETQKLKWAPILKKQQLANQKKGADTTISSKLIMTPIFNQSVVDVSGPDAEAFLDSQLTSDVKNIKIKSLTRSGYCNPKGRLIATPYVIRNADSFNLLLPNDLVDEFISRISRFILRAKVSINENDALAIVGVIAQAGAEISIRELDELDNEILEINSRQGFILCPFDSLESFWVKTTQSYLPSKCEHWEVENIRNGIVNIGDATKEQFLPQMINLEKHKGVSFTKGCYPGQEIVARTKYLGSVKRKLCYFRSDSSIGQGAPILTSEGTPCGTVCHTSRKSKESDNQEGLAVIHINNIDDDKLTTSDSISINALKLI